MSSFSGFSEEDLKRIKSSETGSSTVSTANLKPALLGRQRYIKNVNMKMKTITKQNSDEAIDNIDFDKCKLSLTPKTPPSNVDTNNDNNKENVNGNEIVPPLNKNTTEVTIVNNNNNNVDTANNTNNAKCIDLRAGIAKVIENYSEDEIMNHQTKLQELQLRQKLMEEQNKKRKEMLAKALADRTKQTAEEVMKLEKIKKELQILDSQFSQDVAVLRGKIDQACLSYADAEKHYLRVEKEFLQAKIQLQKEKEKKELLTEHLCALITHNETRKAKKLETLMLELASDKKQDGLTPVEAELEKPVIIDGVEENTGKIVEFAPEN